MGYLKTCTSQSQQNTLLNIRAIPLLSGVYFTATLMALSPNFAIFARVVKMLNFHNVYDFFMFLRKVYKKGEKVRNYCITFSPCLFFSCNEIYIFNI